MPTLVRFRFNKVTGEVEEFLVDDQDRHLPEAEHDRIAAEVGRFVAAFPRLREVGPEGSPLREVEGAREEPAEEAEGGPLVPEVE
ncbi:hypothetical protein [Polyangium jinanense]|uniref:FtsH ternary system domain-containing protein n=1 Tax=Polyangium jinanense TaxID=2829994 RepID=A0A9X3X9E3_9BACT|nr:hypothetical protein [Polyangium jinanense]MDC3957550.1 hypothetical protein [Polyangium jinanense]MDC3984960.1 hypothetical protein [Polyangium jinanense]